MRFEFGDHLLDTERRELRRRGEPIALEPQVFDLLVYLVQNRDRVVRRDDLVTAIWGGRNRFRFGDYHADQRRAARSRGQRLGASGGPYLDAQGRAVHRPGE